MPILKRKRFIVVLSLAIALGGLYWWISKRYVVPILVYHRIELTQEYQPNVVSPKNFEFQMKYLSEHNFHILSVRELAEAIKSKKKMRGKNVVVTFDDGTEDNYISAFSILKKYKIPVMISLVSSYIDQKGFLTLDQIGEMQQAGIDFGSHSKTHPYLPEIPVLKQEEEIKESKKILEKRLGWPVEYFVYPVGGFSEGIKTFVKEAGYKAAFTTNRGYHKLNDDVYELKRIRMTDRDNKNINMWFKLSGFYNAFRKTRDPS